HNTIKLLRGEAARVPANILRIRHTLGKELEGKRVSQSTPKHLCTSAKRSVSSIAESQTHSPEPAAPAQLRPALLVATGTADGSGLCDQFTHSHLSRAHGYYHR